MMPQLIIGKSLAPSLSVLTRESEKNHYWKTLMADWNLRRRKGFPGCNPKSICRESLGLLNKHNYMVTLKSDGVRYILYCTTRPNSTQSQPLPVALMIDRSQNMYEVDVIAQEDFFIKGTILEGELVWKQPEEKTLMFLVFDCIRCRGESFLHRSFLERFQEVDRLVRFSAELSQLHDVEQRALETNNVVMMQYQPRVFMHAKIFVDLSNAQRLWERRSDIEHRVDGLIIQRTDAPYVMGTANDGEVFKWKQNSTLDLSGPSLKAADGDINSTYFGRRVITATESKIKATSEDDVVEYMINVTEKTVELFALRRRLDKKTANGIRVVEATILDAIENIQPNELLPC